MSRLDLDAIRRDHPVASVAGAVMNLRPAHGELRGCCPFHDDRSPSFYVFAGGQRWHCFGCGETGDVLDFVGRYYRLGLRDAAERLCGGNLPVVDAPPMRARRQRDNGYALSLWQSAAPIAGTAAERYLRARGIRQPLPDALRFSRLTPPKDSGVEAANGRDLLPALVALVTGPDGQPAGIQRTFLTEEGRKAASADGKVKFSLGNVRGGAIRLGAALASGLAVTEGVEDALSLIELGAPAAWAAAGSGMLPGMELPAVVRSVVIGADADEAGRIAASKAAVALAGSDRTTRIIFPAAPHKDFNDELRGVAA